MTRGIKNYETIDCLNCNKIFNAPAYAKRKYCCLNCAYKHKLNPTAFKKGRIVPKEEIEKTIKKRIGFKHSEESKIKMGNARRGKKFPTARKNPQIFKKGNKPWNYIDGRSKIKSPLRYGNDWSMIRLAIYKRDNWTCQKCKLKMTYKTGAHDVHHKIPFLQSFDNSMDNLITLCRSCHMKEESKIIKQVAGAIELAKIQKKKSDQ